MNLLHFTNNTSLLSILESKQLWASNYSFLNDQDEVIHLKEIFFEENKKFLKAGQESSKKFISFINRLFEKYFNRFNKNAYIISFTTNEDKFNLWSYFSHDNGYSINFNYNNFCQKLKINKNFGKFQENNNNISDSDHIIIPKSKLLNVNMLHTEILHRKVIYSENEKRKYIKEALSSYYSSNRDRDEMEDGFTSFDHLVS